MNRYLTVVVLLMFASCESENKSPFILQATYDSGPSSSFAFRKDGTFRWSNGSGLGVSETEGKYSIKDSVITLDKIGFDKVVKSNRLLITTIQPNSRAVGKYVIQVDEKNSLIDSIFIFTVYLDKRDLL